MNEIKTVLREALPLFVAFVAAALFMAWLDEKKNVRATVDPILDPDAANLDQNQNSNDPGSNPQR